MSHFIEKCRCGKVLTQCRCPDPNKTVTISKEPCKHYPDCYCVCHSMVSSRAFCEHCEGRNPVAEFHKKKDQTMVSVKPVLELIKYHAEGDFDKAKAAAMEIAEELDKENQELSSYIFIQYHPEAGWSPQ